MKALSWLAWVPLVIVGALALGTGIFMGVWMLFGWLWFLGIVFLWLAGLGLFLIIYAATAFRHSENHFTNILFLVVLGIVLILQTALALPMSLASDGSFFFFWEDIVALLLWIVAVVSYANFRRSLSAEQTSLAHFPPNDNL